MSKYSERFWRKSYDPGVKDLDPKVWEITYPDALRDVFNRFPNKIALTFQGLEISYAQVDKYSNQFANMLIKNGFKKGDIVGINLPNTPEYIYAFLGTLKAGCIVSGISPLLSDVQMHYQINDLGSSGNNIALVTLDAIFEHRLKNIYTKLPQLKVVVTTSVIGSFPKDQQAKIKAVQQIPSGVVTPLEGKIVLDFHDEVLKQYSTDLPKVKVSPDDVAFIQYTGGTTGPPKGAMLTHKNSVSDILLIQSWVKWEKGAGVALSGFPFFHIAGLYFGQACLYLGWTQCLIPDPRNALHICNEISKYKPSTIVNVPSLYQILIKFKKFKRLDHSTLDLCISGAAPFPIESQKELESIVGEGKILEVLGMTETSPLTTFNPYRGKRKLGTVGLPAPNTDIKIVDPETNKEVPIGEPGEILVRGPMVTKGYFNKPEETAKALEKDGFLHTGDVGIMDEDGFIKIVDRTKDMIIVGGFKVFSSKVEDILCKHPAISMIALIGKPNPDRPGSEIVNAYITLNPDYQYDGNEEALKKSISDFAKEKLSPYEIPKVIEIVKDLPLTAVGKIDKKILRKSK